MTKKAQLQSAFTYDGIEKLKGPIQDLVYLSEGLQTKNCIVLEMHEQLVRFMKAFQTESNLEESCQSLVAILSVCLNDQIRLNLTKFYSSLQQPGLQVATQEIYVKCFDVDNYPHGDNRTFISPARIQLQELI